MTRMSYSDDLKKQRIADSWALRMRGPNATTSTLGGRMEAQRMKADMPRPSPSISNFASTSKLPSATIFRRGRSNQQAAVPKPLGTTGESKHLLSYILCVVAGVISVVFVASHGVTSGLGEATAFVVTFAASYILLRYIKLLISIAVLGFILYEVIHLFAGH